MDDSFSKHFELCFSSTDVKSIAKNVIQQGKKRHPCDNRYRLACAKYLKPNCMFRYNFHPFTGLWLGKENRNFEKLQQAVKEEYHQLSELFKKHFTADDVKSIASEVIQLGNQRDRYLVACEKYCKPNCTLRYNFHPTTGVWLGSPSENRAIGRLKTAVGKLKGKLRKQNDEQVIREKENQLIAVRASEESLQHMCNSLISKSKVRKKRLSKFQSRSYSARSRLGRLKRKHDEVTQVIVSTYVHLCDDTHTFIPHITLGTQ